VTTSIDWYNANGQTFFANSAYVEDLPQRLQFQAHIPPGGTVLDAGCGSGRDALAFVREGYDVTAIDGSAEMVRLSTRHTGLAVRLMSFDEIDWREAFDGVWACASLLHVPPDALPGVIGRIRRALKPGGVFFSSFKLGAGLRSANGRWFSDLEPTSLRRLLEAGALDVLTTEVTQDLRPDRKNEMWVSALARRPPAADAITAFVKAGASPR